MVTLYRKKILTLGMEMSLQRDIIPFRIIYYGDKALTSHLRDGGAFPHPRNNGKICSYCKVLVSSSIGGRGMV